MGGVLGGELGVRGGQGDPGRDRGGALWANGRIPGRFWKGPGAAWKTGFSFFLEAHLSMV